MNTSTEELFDNLLAEVLVDPPASSPLAGININAFLNATPLYQEVFAFLVQKLVAAHHIGVTGCYSSFQTCMDDIRRHRFENGEKEYCIPVGYFPTRFPNGEQWWLVKYNIAIRAAINLKVYIQVGDDTDSDIATREVEIAWNQLTALPRIALQMINALNQTGNTPEYDEDNDFEEGVSRFLRRDNVVTRAIIPRRRMPHRSFGDIIALTMLLISKKDKMDN